MPVLRGGIVGFGVESSAAVGFDVFYDPMAKILAQAAGRLTLTPHWAQGFGLTRCEDGV